jgi:DNA-binding YbaB/EbfC family protein
MNPFDLLKNLNLEDIKKKSEEMTNTMKDMVVTGESGGGFVKVTINGEFLILAIDYENNDMLKDDLSTFRNLIIAAQNDAVIKMKHEIQKKFAGNFIPGLL